MNPAQIGFFIGTFAGTMFLVAIWLLVCYAIPALRRKPRLGYGIAMALALAAAFIPIDSPNATTISVAIICIALLYWQLRRAERTLAAALLSKPPSAPSSSTVPVATQEQMPTMIKAGAQGVATNYLARHWRGELSLGVSYWVNGGLIAGVVPAVLSAMVGGMNSDAYSLRVMSLAYISVLIFILTSWVWAVVGIWRCADRHTERRGHIGWANAAKVMVVVGAIATVGNLTTTVIPQFSELAMIALGLDPMGKVEVKVAGDGRSIVIHGALREGSANDIQKILDAAPAAKTLVFNSPGGRLSEAQKLAHTIRARRLNTYVEDECASACTYAFLAGLDRAATPNAKIGFHQPSLPGLNSTMQQSATEDMASVYRSAGIPESFIRRVESIGSKDMWYPTRDELIEAGVITRVSLGGEASLLGLSGMRSKQEMLLTLRDDPLFQALDRRFPGTSSLAVDRGWLAKEAGGSDADVSNAMRSGIGDVYPKLLRTADDATLDQFNRLLVKEMIAARAVSVEACTKLLAAQLNIVMTLPPEIWKEEQKFLIDALNAPARERAVPIEKRAFQQAIRSAASTMPAELVRVVADPGAFADQPRLICDASVAFHQAIQGLPGELRVVALRGMLQAED